ncbi:hypothetical protein THRCLA_22518 [Thraustotheca clavata]|uniref:Secreted protein n=1 Tax=Thraustotheca clavata TaxID=74557 RepID=A0A1V9YYC1_9STRA|nr:hypothetical protein THRCLA_22518 [Thraustotheca clavata]
MKLFGLAKFTAVLGTWISRAEAVLIEHIAITVYQYSNKKNSGCHGTQYHKNLAGNSHWNSITISNRSHCHHC